VTLLASVGEFAEYNDECSRLLQILASCMKKKKGKSGYINVRLKADYMSQG